MSSRTRTSDHSQAHRVPGLDESSAAACPSTPSTFIAASGCGKTTLRIKSSSPTPAPSARCSTSRCWASGHQMRAYQQQFKFFDQTR